MSKNKRQNMNTVSFRGMLVGWLVLEKHQWRSNRREHSVLNVPSQCWPSGVCVCLSLVVQTQTQRGKNSFLNCWLLEMKRLIQAEGGRWCQNHSRDAEQIRKWTDWRHCLTKTPMETQSIASKWLGIVNGISCLMLASQRVTACVLHIE